jgi:hypothetical protein
MAEVLRQYSLLELMMTQLRVFAVLCVSLFLVRGQPNCPNWVPAIYDLSEVSVERFLSNFLDLQPSLDFFKTPGHVGLPTFRHGITPPSCIASSTGGNLSWVNNLVPHGQLSAAAELEGSNWVVNAFNSSWAETWIAEGSSGLPQFDFSIINSTAISLDFNVMAKVHVPVLARPATISCVQERETCAPDNPGCVPQFSTRCTCAVDDRDVCSGDALVSGTTGVHVEILFGTSVVSFNNISFSRSSIQNVKTRTQAFTVSEVKSPCVSKGIRDEMLPQIAQAVTNEQGYLESSLSSLLQGQIQVGMAQQLQSLLLSRNYTIRDNVWPSDLQIEHSIGFISFDQSLKRSRFSVQSNMITEYQGSWKLFPEAIQCSDENSVSLQQCSVDQSSSGSSKVCYASSVLNVFGWLANVFELLQDSSANQILDANITGDSNFSTPLVSSGESNLKVRIDQGNVHFTCPKHGSGAQEVVVLDVAFKNLQTSGSLIANVENGSTLLYYSLDNSSFQTFDLTNVQPSFGLPLDVIAEMIQFFVRNQIADINTKIKELSLKLDPITSLLVINPVASVHDSYFVLSSSTSSVEFDDESILVAQESCSPVDLEFFFAFNER